MTLRQSLSKYIKSPENVELIIKYTQNYCLVKNVELDEDLIYELVGYILLLQQQEEHGKNLVKKLLTLLYKKKIGWEHPIFASVRELQIEQDEFITNPVEVEEGVLECNKCNSKKTFSFQCQTRSADEGSTTFAQCANCGNKWKNCN
jgi:DNA-directed RNA polymerase subunit M/transcription elongation factor TFIIS